MAAGPSPHCDEAALDDGLRHSDSADEAAPHLESEGAAKVVISGIARAVWRAVVTVAVASVLRGVLNTASPPTPAEDNGVVRGVSPANAVVGSKRDLVKRSLDWEETKLCRQAVCDEDGGRCDGR